MRKSISRLGAPDSGAGASTIGSSEAVMLAGLAFKLRDGMPYSVYDLSDKLRQGGWQVPAFAH